MKMNHVGPLGIIRKILYYLMKTKFVTHNAKLPKFSFPIEFIIFNVERNQKIWKQAKKI